MGPKERIGRRLFDRVGDERDVEEDGSVSPRFADFFSADPERDHLSTDRLGPTGIVKAVLRRLTPLADYEATNRNPQHSFRGWSSVPRDQIRSPDWRPKVFPTPIDEDPPNPWHAEIDCSEWRGKRLAYAMALILRDLYQREGQFSSPER